MLETLNKSKKKWMIFLFNVFLLLTRYKNFTFANDLPPRYEAEKFGYTEEILNLLPTNHFPRAPNPDLNNISKKVEPEVIELNVRYVEKPENVNLYKYLVKLYEKNPTSSRIIKKLAITAYKAKLYQESLHWFMQAYLFDKNDLMSLWNCAVISHLLGNFEDSNKFFKEYITKDPYSIWGRIAIEMLNYKPYNTQIRIKDLVEKKEDDLYKDKSVMIVVNKVKTYQTPTLSEKKIKKKSEHIQSNIK